MTWRACEILLISIALSAMRLKACGPVHGRHLKDVSFEKNYRQIKQAMKQELMGLSCLHSVTFIAHQVSSLSLGYVCLYLENISLERREKFA